ncbi:MAG: hypothetical protein V4482_02450, partial [Pseudomonadota bacterium]
MFKHKFFVLTLLAATASTVFSASQNASSGSGAAPTVAPTAQSGTTPISVATTSIQHMATSVPGVNPRRAPASTPYDCNYYSCGYTADPLTISYCTSLTGDNARIAMGCYIRYVEAHMCPTGEDAPTNPPLDVKPDGTGRCQIARAQLVLGMQAAYANDPHIFHKVSHSEADSVANPTQASALAPARHATATASVPAAPATTAHATATPVVPATPAASATTAHATA